MAGHGETCKASRRHTGNRCGKSEKSLPNSSEIACVPSCHVCHGLNEKANIAPLGALDHAEEWPAPMEYAAGGSRSGAEWLALDAHVETILDAICGCQSLMVCLRCWIDCIANKSRLWVYVPQARVALRQPDA